MKTCENSLGGKKEVCSCIIIEEGVRELTEKISAKKVVLPSTLETVDARVFDESVEEIEVAENSVYSIINGALLSKDGTLVFLPKNCKIPDCTERIAPYSCKFLECDELVLPNHLKEIQSFGLAGSKISSVVCNEKFEKIGSNAFHSFNLGTGIKSIQLNDGLKEIGDNAFEGTLLTEIFIPKSVKTIGILPFDIRGKLKKIEVDAGNEKYYSNGSNAIIEKECEKLIVGCKKTVIPSTVREIGEKAFYSCGIAKIDFPSSVRVIGDYSFAFNKLKTIDIRNVSTVGVGAFENNRDLESIIFSNHMTDMPSHFASGCDHLKTIELPNSIELIQTDAFSNFLGDTIVINSDVKVIETRAISSNCAQIVYNGTKQQWLNVIGNRNVYYHDYGEPKQPKNYTVQCPDGPLTIAVFEE